ncbi:RNase H domain-containing protein [Trichonephila clavipes]|nr:RNase H domain-containing protein [Trichonephila clavipes]
MFNTARHLHCSHKVWKSTVRTHERTRGRKVASSSPVATEDPPYKWVRGSVSPFWCGVVGKGSLAQVSSSSLDRGSKLEVRLNSPSSVVKHLLGGGSSIITQSVSGNRTLSHRLRCVVYGSACNSTLKKLDPVHHMALRICSGTFRTSPVQSLYVTCYQLPLDLRRRKLSLAYYSKILSVPSHPLQNVYMSTSMKRLYDARPSNIRPFMDRMKLHISELDLPNVHIQQRNLFLFQPWSTPRFHFINPFATYSKSTVAPVVFQRVFTYHRSQYSSYSTIYTDGSKRADYVGCGVVIEDIMHGYRLDTSCSIFTTEAVAIYLWPR